MRKKQTIEELVFSVIGREELDRLLAAYQRGARGRVLIACVGTKRVHTAARVHFRPEELQRNLASWGCDGWLILSPSHGGDHVSIEGELQGVQIEVVFDRARIEGRRKYRDDSRISLIADESASG